ncbi:MAG TPA: xanthine dehydrogenase, partial [Oscillibacter sp.]|nr:xanthine dehydrogenase [Oscillibacter sp.]
GWLVLPLDGGAPRVTEQPETDENSFSMELPVGERALILGAGHIARALVPLLRTVGFRPVVLDDRPGFATAENFPQADDTICAAFTPLEDSVTLTPEDYVVIMTNGHEHDFQCEVQVLRRETAYVGVIGSRKKTAYVNQRLREAGIPEEKIAFVHTPIGTAIKAVTPEEIAVSIAGEMICVRATRREAAGEVHHGCPMH